MIIPPKESRRRKRKANPESEYLSAQDNNGLMIHQVKIHRSIYGLTGTHIIQG